MLERLQFIDDNRVKECEEILSAQRFLLNVTALNTLTFAEDLLERARELQLL